MTNNGCHFRIIPSMIPTRIIVGLGEALFDLFSDQALLGGAPLNVAVHAQQLGNQGMVVSRVGQDELGRRVEQDLRSRGMSTEYLQTDPDRPTGTVSVELNTAGQPTFTITPQVAWDALQFDPDTESLARRCDAVCFGSLAQRGAQARNTIYRFLETARGAIRLFDVNLRQDYYDRQILRRSLDLATAVKLNEQELGVIGGLFQLGPDPRSAAQKLMKDYGLQWVALTRGERGTTVYTAAYDYVGSPVPAKEGGDAVGAGDAAAAALLHGAVRRWPWERTVALANTVGSYVASHRGACPPMNEEIRKSAV